MPAIITSVAGVPACVALVAYLNAAHPLPWPAVAAWSLVALAVLLVNLAAIHWMAAGFERWLRGHYRSANRL
jgi:hypothetical protein